jgi:membrane protein DedA with SNARE-associated domain
MGPLIDKTTELAMTHPGLALLIVFAAGAAESLLFLGLLPIVLTGACAAATAKLPIGPYFIAAMTGGVLGDFLAYSAGARYGSWLEKRWPLRLMPGLVSRAEGILQRHDLSSVAICRFLPLLRATVPFVAGMAAMTKTRFLAANIGAALVWAPAHILPAKFAGHAMQHLREGHWGAAIWAAVGLTVALAAAYWVHRFAHHRLGGHAVKPAPATNPAVLPG